MSPVAAIPDQLSLSMQAFALKPPRNLSPTESPLLFEMLDEPLEETLTAWGGVPLVVQALRSLGVPASVRRHMQIKQREQGYDVGEIPCDGLMRL